MQELTKSEIDTHNIIVNQLVFPDKNTGMTTLNLILIVIRDKFQRYLWVYNGCHFRVCWSNSWTTRIAVKKNCLFDILSA